MININQDAALLNKQFPNVPIPKIVEFLTKFVRQYPQLNDEQLIDLLKTVFAHLASKKTGAAPMQMPAQTQQVPQTPRPFGQSLLSNIPTGAH